MKKAISLFLSLFIVLTLSACSESHEEIEKDLSTTLEAIRKDKLDDSYLYSPNLLGIDLTSRPVQEEVNSQITKKISEKAKVEIGEISNDDEAAEAELTITAPDSYKMLKDLAATMKEYDVEQYLDKFESALDNDYPTKDFKVKVELKLLNDHWYLVPNDELSNAYSGGLVQEYFELGKKKVENIIGKEDEK